MQIQLKRRVHIEMFEKAELEIYELKLEVGTDMFVSGDEKGDGTADNNEGNEGVYN